jgi:hypothetical protein
LNRDQSIKTDQNKNYMRWFIYVILSKILVLDLFLDTLLVLFDWKWDLSLKLHLSDCYYVGNIYIIYIRQGCFIYKCIYIFTYSNSL